MHRALIFRSILKRQLFLSPGKSSIVCIMTNISIGVAGAAWCTKRVLTLNKRTREWQQPAHNEPSRGFLSLARTFFFAHITERVHPCATELGNTSVSASPAPARWCSAFPARYSWPGRLCAEHDTRSSFGNPKDGACSQSIKAEMPAECIVYTGARHYLEGRELKICL